MGKVVKEKKLMPYSVYLPADYYAKIKKLAKERKASSTVRDAIMMIIDGNDEYRAGYNQGLRDAVKAVDKIKGVEMIAINGKYLSDVFYETVSKMEVK